MFSGTVEELKMFMTVLLRGDLFDFWEVKEARVETFFELSVNGRVKKDFFDEEERAEREFINWRDVKDLFFGVIKGKRLPGMFRVVLSADKSRTEEILRSCGKEQEEAGATLYLNMHYNGKCCRVVGGVSHVGFTMDKTLEQAWDEALQRFFMEHKIIVSTQ